MIDIFCLITSRMNYCEGYGKKQFDEATPISWDGKELPHVFIQGNWNRYNFKYLKHDDGVSYPIYLVQKDGVVGSSDGEKSKNGSPYYRVYKVQDGTRVCGLNIRNNPITPDISEKPFDTVFQIWAKNQANGGVPRPKKTKKQAVLPDGKIYELFKSGKKWYVERECQSGTKKLVLVHPKKQVHRN